MKINSDSQDEKMYKDTSNPNENVKNNRNKIIISICTIVWIFIIFQFSLHEGQSSSQMSGRVVQWMSDVFRVRFSGFFIRKLAHFSEYTILGVLSGLAVPFYKKKNPYLWAAWLFGTGIAATDEFIQYFIPGRSGNIIDVLIDSSGVLFGVMLIFLFSKIQKIRTVY